MPRKTKKTGPLISHTGIPLTRDTSFKFALDLNSGQAVECFTFAGASRFAFNHHVGRVKANLGQREAERSYDVPAKELTPSLSWSTFSLVNEFNAWKNGELPTSPVSEDGSSGLAWRREVSHDVFETASVDAAQALKNFSDSRTGKRQGVKVRFPKFKAKNKTIPSFRLRNHGLPGQPQSIRVTGPKTIKVPVLVVLRVHGSTRAIRRMIEKGRFHIYSATFKFERGKWWVSLTGLAAVFHPARRSPKGRHPLPAGMDMGSRTQAVTADINGELLDSTEGVKPLKAALDRSSDRLRLASRAYARTKPGSKGRRKAKRKLTKIHARIFHQRRHGLHLLSYWAATSLTSLTVEDLNLEGMKQLSSLARSITDVSPGTLKWQLEYKSRWYGLELTEASRWYPSSKTCSGCGNIKTDLTMSDRVYACTKCNLVIDRDLNAAINLARYPTREAALPPPPVIA